MTNKAAVYLSKAIGIYQISGGLIILILGLNQLLFHFSINVYFLFYTLMAIGFSSFSIYTGTNCYQATAFGLKLTFYNQMIQLLCFSFSGFEFLYSAGVGFFIGLDLTKEVIFLHKFTLLYIKLGKANSNEIVFLINVIPLIIISLLDSIQNRLNLNRLPYDDFYFTYQRTHK